MIFLILLQQLHVFPQSPLLELACRHSFIASADLCITKHYTVSNCLQ